MSDPTPPRLPAPTLAFIASAGLQELTFPPAQQIIPGADSYLNWPYALVPGVRMLRLDVHMPRDVSGPVPVIVFAPGGAWLLAAKNHSPWQAALDAGYAVVSFEYRLSTEARFPAQLHDAKAVIRWVRGNAGQFGFDPSRIVGWGCSAGGYIMSMAGVTNDRSEFEGSVGEHPTESSALSAVIAHYAPSDLATMGDDTNHLPGVMQPMGTADAPEAKLVGFVPASDPAAAADLNVATHVTRDTVPFLIMHGDADTRLGIGQSRRLHAALLAAGTDVTFVVIPGANHAGPEFLTAEVVEPTLAFLHRVVG